MLNPEFQHLIDPNFKSVISEETIQKMIQDSVDWDPEYGYDEYEPSTDDYEFSMDEVMDIIRNAY